MKTTSVRPCRAGAVENARLPASLPAKHPAQLATRFVLKKKNNFKK